jgi:hypothetical protein
VLYMIIHGHHFSPLSSLLVHHHICIRTSIVCVSIEDVSLLFLLSSTLCMFALLIANITIICYHVSFLPCFIASRIPLFILLLLSLSSSSFNRSDNLRTCPIITIYLCCKTTVHTVTLQHIFLLI